MGWIAGCRKEIVAACVIATISSVMASAAFARHNAFNLTCTPSRVAADQDQITTAACKKDLAVVDIHMKRGINSAILSFSKNYKPKSLRIRFNGFTTLESFEISNGNTKYASSLNTSPLTRETVRGNSDPNHQAAPVQIEIAGPTKGKLITVDVPCAAVLGNDNECEISWIDSFR